MTGCARPADERCRWLLSDVEWGLVKAKTRAKLAKGRAAETGTFQDPIRLYERPIWFDVWFIVGLMLTVPDILVGILVLLKAGSWELANASISGLFFSGYLYLSVEIIAKFSLGSLLPVFIRRSMRRGKLKVAPMRLDPGFYEDPIRKGSQRFWDGTAWTAELRAPYKRQPGRMLFLCGVFFLLSLLIGLGFAVKTLSAVKVQRSYEASTSLVVQLGTLSPEAVVEQGPMFAEASSTLNAAVAAYPRKDGEATEVDGIDLVLYESFATAFASLADQVQGLAGQIQACESADSACASAAVKSASPTITSAAAALPPVLTREQAALQ
jgi:membrane protein implicated in regulation of membrane protease activity